MLPSSITVNRHRLKSNVVGLWVTCFIAPAVWGQEAVAFHTSTREVLVDAAVVDKKGNFERGLTREDFRLWEDGKEQKITSFSHEGQAGVDRRNDRYVALVFDDDRPGLRDEVIQFVNRFASPGFHMAIFSRVDSKMVLQQAFTEDAEQVKTVLRTMTVTVGKRLKEGGQGFNLFIERVNNIAIALAPVRGAKSVDLVQLRPFQLPRRSGPERWSIFEVQRPAACRGFALSNRRYLQCRQCFGLRICDW
jgi:hypothetical protein